MSATVNAGTISGYALSGSAPTHTNAGCWAASKVDDDVMYYFGGADTDDLLLGPYSHDLFELTASTGVWRNLTALAGALAVEPVGRQQCALEVVAMGGVDIVFLLGGIGNDFGPLDDFWAFNTDTLTWHEFAGASSYAVSGSGREVTGHSMHYHHDGTDGRLVVINIAVLSSIDVCVLDSTWSGAHTWTLAAATGTGPNQRQRFSSAMLEYGGASFIYVFGGFSTVGTQFFNSMHQLAVDTWTWTELAVAGDAPGERQGAVMLPVGRLSANRSRVLLVFGGDSGVTDYDDMYALHVDDAGADTPRWYAVVPSGNALYASSLGWGHVHQDIDVVLGGGASAVTKSMALSMGPRATTVSPGGARETGGQNITITGVLSHAPGNISHIEMLRLPVSSPEEVYACDVVQTTGMAPVTDVVCTTRAMATTNATAGESYLVRVVTTAGFPVFSPLDAFRVVPRPRPTAAVEAARSEVALLADAGGDELVITGPADGVLAADASDLVSVTLEPGALACAPATWVSTSEVRCIAPALAAAAYNVTLEALMGGPSVYEVAPTIFAVPAPNVTVIHTASVRQTGGDTVSVSGTWIGGAAESVLSLEGATGADAGTTVDNALQAVAISGATCTPVTSTGTAFTCTTSAFSAGGSFPLDVTTRIGGASTSAVLLTVVPAPVVTFVAPTAGHAGDSITIQGSDLGVNAADIASVTIGGAACGSVVTTDTPVTSLTCTVGAATAGTYDPIVTTSSGGTGTAAVQFTLNPGPVVTGVSPSSGYAGDSVVLTGTDLGLTSGDISSVTIGGATCVVTTTTGTPVTAITCTVGAAAAGSYDPIVTTASGGVGSATAQYTVNSGPLVTSVTPSSGPVGTSVTVSGTDLGTSASDITGVTIGSAACTVSSTTGTPVTSLVCVVGATPAGSYDVVVTTTSGGIGSSSVQFTVNSAPVVTSVNPQVGAEGDTLTLQGTDLGANTQDIVSVTIGGASCAVAATLGEPITSLTCVMSATTAGTYDIIVTTTSGGTGSSTVQFQYLPGSEGITESPAPSSDDSELWMWVAIGGGGALLICCHIIAFIVIRKMRKEEEPEFIDPEAKEPTSYLTESSSLEVLPDARSPNKIIRKRRVRRKSIQFEADFVETSSAGSTTACDTTAFDTSLCTYDDDELSFCSTEDSESIGFDQARPAPRPTSRASGTRTSGLGSRTSHRRKRVRKHL